MVASAIFMNNVRSIFNGITKGERGEWPTSANLFLVVHHATVKVTCNTCRLYHPVLIRRIEAALQSFTCQLLIDTFSSKAIQCF
jgi:transposase-like protein